MYGIQDLLCEDVKLPRLFFYFRTCCSPVRNVELFKLHLKVCISYLLYRQVHSLDQEFSTAHY